MDPSFTVAVTAAAERIVDRCAASGEGHEDKLRGNEEFKKGNYSAAVAAYSDAIRCDIYNPVYYSNRAMAALKVTRILVRQVPHHS